MQWKFLFLFLFFASQNGWWYRKISLEREYQLLTANGADGIGKSFFLSDVLVIIVIFMTHDKSHKCTFYDVEIFTKYFFSFFLEIFSLFFIVSIASKYVQKNIQRWISLWVFSMIRGFFKFFNEIPKKL